VKNLSLIKEVQIENAKKNILGDVILKKLRMRRKVPDVDGYIKVLPNLYPKTNIKKIDNIPIVYGCSELSPMVLGPIEHGQPISIEHRTLMKISDEIKVLPKCQNVENFHQGTKVFEEELDEHNNPSELYYENREKFYADSVPHRYKFKGKEVNINIPKYFLWVDKSCTEHHLNYFQSRQFYCNFYERLVLKKESEALKRFTELKQLIKDGYSLCILSYDAHPIGKTKIDIENEYLDLTRPFGHEKLLFSMLVLDDPNDYPRRKYKTFDF